MSRLKFARGVALIIASSCFATAATATCATALALAGNRVRSATATNGAITFAVDWPRGLDWGSDPARETVELCNAVVGHGASRFTRSASGTAFADPSWSPDGARIAATLDVPGLGSSSVFRTASGVVAGRGIGGAHPSWSPDGRSVAVQVRTNAGDRVAVAPADGSSVPVVISSGPGADVAPAWSPDGSWIAFTSTRNGGLAQLYLIHPDGTGETRLTRGTTQDLSPAWAPDSRRVLFIASSAAGSRIATIAADGSVRRSLQVKATDATYSPDGRYIAFVENDGAVGVVRSDGSAPRALYRGAQAASGVSWQPLSTRQPPAADPRPCVITGTEHRDVLYGSRFDDAIVGAQGNDVIRPLGGHDLVFGGQGNDTIYARDGLRDWISCGPGRDIVYADSGDVVARDCERVFR